MRAAQVNAVEKTAWVYCDNNASAGILPLPTICTWWMTMPILMIPSYHDISEILKFSMEFIKTLMVVEVDGEE